jgi:outer membrane biosynthesis protein TonB
MNNDGLKNSLVVSAVVHFVALLFLYFGLPHLMPPLPEHHVVVPFQIVQIADLTNTRLKEEEPPPKPPEPEPPKPQPKPEQAVTPPPPPKPPEPVKQPEAVKPPEPLTEGLKAAPVPKEKPPQPKAATQVNEDLSKLLKNLEQNKKVQAPKVEDSKADSKTPSPAAVSQATALSSRLTISEEDALRRQISSCWNAPVGARDIENLIVELIIDVNPDRTVLNAEIVDKSRAASDPFFRAAAESAMRAVRNPKCSPLELPADKYDQWKRIDFTFDPRDMI